MFEISSRVSHPLLSRAIFMMHYLISLVLHLEGLLKGPPAHASSLAAQSQYFQEVIIVRNLIASASACFVPFNIYDALFDFTSASSGGSTQGAAGICQFPGCLKPVFPGSNFCSIIHRECASLLISTLILDFNLACLMLVWQNYSSLAQGRATVQEYANSLAVQSQSFQEVIIVR